MAAGLQSMCEYWKKFDLQELQKELDTTATELANRQDESDISRKRLVEQSRNFKKNTPEDLRKVAAPLLKSFQAEVDALSKRSKAAEAAFLSVYKKLIDLPDPVPVLEYALQIQKKAQRVQDLEIENKQLRETLDEYNHEFAEVKNQEVTIKQLRDRIKECEEKAEEVAEARTKEKERELQRIFAEKERHLQETQLSIVKKLGEAEAKVSSLQSNLENVQSELFEVKTKYDEAVSAKSDEMDIVMSDLERANERASSAEREVEKLKQQLVTITSNLTQSQQTQKGPDMEHAIDILQRSSLEVELAAKEKEISQLVEDVRRLQTSLTKLKETTEVQVAKLEEELAYKNKALMILEEKLQRQEDYEEIKRELNVLKSIEFPSSSTGEEREGSKAKSLEILLLEKNKTLQSENTQLKVSSGDLSGNTSPTLSSNAEAFATMLGKEIAETYQLPGKDSSRESSPVNSPNESIDAPSPKDECPASHQDSNAFFQGHLKPPKTPSTPTTPLNSIDMHRFPPPSPVQQFYSPFGNNHLMNFMNMAAVKPDMNGTQGLDTGMVAKTVRELLSIHNIGQRLFAKHILGLSQGTVSELLSKPKSWDKLTEKGRESYRKMHAWAVDERNILALKAISPKKGSQPLLPTIQREDSATEERISQILNEAQHAMQMKKVMEQQHVANAMATSIYHEMARYNSFQNSHPISTTNPTPSANTISNGISEHRGRKHSENERSYKREPSYEGDVSSKEMVERIYRQELMKLAQAAENAGNIAAVTLYRQELSRLAHNSQVRHQDEREPGELRRARDEPDGISVKTEPPDSTSDDLVSNGPIDLSKHSNSKPTTPTSSGSEKSLNSNSAHPTPSAFFLVRPNTNGHDKFDNHPPPTQPNVGPFSPTECVSPLQRMQNIANSLMTRSHVGPPITKSMKAVLPPITQEEFDKYSNMNTDDLVKKVKETLSQYSISQRLFGESVLGLSQGSVSDLLARPKPWHMLTQKGREPFIRMQLFLEDAEAIPKLVASQYHIPPDKLMRSQSVNKEPTNRRRRSSLEDRYDSPVSLPKRPRVFFTEEQKDILRTAYSHDPYPNQNTIEGLANELNVGVKTVINWFHNHRMRAKQQQHNSNGPINNLNDSFGSSKSDQLDENSNQSDLSSLSGDNGNFTSGFRNHDSSQWMFPQFELMATIGNQSNSGESDAEEKEEGEEEEEEEARSPSSTKENPLEITKDKEKTKKSTNSSDESSDTQPLEEKVSNESDNMAINQSQSAPPSSGSNKRKRSNPQYVSAGRNLDRTMPDYDEAVSDSIKITSSHEEDIDTEKENEASERYKQLQVEYQEVVSTVQEQKQLIHQLEEDLRSMNALSSMFRGDAEGIETVSSTPSAELMAEVIKDAKLEGSFSMYDTQSSKSAANSLLPIVQSQRERYRIRALELEAQVLSQQQQVAMFQNEMDKLRSDNVKLYEKVRYLQSAGYPHKEKITGDDGTLNRYSTQYEEKLDPFSSFSRKEKTRKYMNLKPYDKITLSMGKFIMGNKLARTITFFYTLLLHCLVFLVLYKLAHTETCKRDMAAECQQQFAEHMLSAHGGNH